MTARRGLNVLGLHLMAAMGVWQSGLAMAPLARLGLAPWHPRLAARGSALAESLAEIAPDRLAAALMTEAAARFAGFARGIELYESHPYRRPPDDRAVILQMGTTRLLGPKDEAGKPVLVVPSPLNRWHIWDLPSGRGFLSGLEARGLSPYVIDWQEPGPDEAEFSVADHVKRRLEPALAAIAARRPGSRIGLAGHCLGGLLALALAQHRPKDIACLMLVATPWDFTRMRGFAARLAMAAPATDLVARWLALVEPGGVETRFRHFAEWDQDGPEAADFVAIEDWVNDGIALPPPAAAEIFGDWMRGIPPLGAEAVLCPALVVTALRDRLVPSAAARPLAAALPKARLVEIDTGHVGLFVGSVAKTQVMAPAAAWLAQSIPPAAAYRGTKKLARKGRSNRREP